VCVDSRGGAEGVKVWRPCGLFVVWKQLEAAGSGAVVAGSGVGWRWKIASPLSGGEGKAETRREQLILAHRVCGNWARVWRERSRESGRELFAADIGVWGGGWWDGVRMLHRSGDSGRILSGCESGGESKVFARVKGPCSRSALRAGICRSLGWGAGGRRWLRLMDGESRVTSIITRRV